MWKQNLRFLPAIAFAVSGLELYVESRRCSDVMSLQSRRYIKNFRGAGGHFIGKIGVLAWNKSVLSSDLDHTIVSVKHDAGL